MTTKEIQKLRMFYAVRETCRKHEKIWNDYQPFRSTFETFCNKIEEIERNRDLQSEKPGILVREKNRQRQLLSLNALFVAGRISSFALVSENKPLYETVRFTPSEFKRSPDTKVINMCQTILAVASEQLPGLEPYGISKVDLANLADETGQFGDTLSQLREKVLQQVTATANILELFGLMRILLTARLDVDAGFFARSHPGFYNEYLLSRNIPGKEDSSPPALICGTVIRSDTGEPLEGVNIRVGKRRIRTTTSSDGKFSLELPKQIKLTLIAEYNGADQVRKTIELQNNDRLELNLEISGQTKYYYEHEHNQ